MLKIEDVEEFANYLASPQVDDDFKYGTEAEKIALLELLEKVMDVAEKADEVATRLIFRGRVPTAETHQ